MAKTASVGIWTKPLNWNITWAMTDDVSQVHKNTSTDNNAYSETASERTLPKSVLLLLCLFCLDSVTTLELMKDNFIFNKQYLRSHFRAPDPISVMLAKEQNKTKHSISTIYEKMMKRGQKHVELH